MSRNKFIFAAITAILFCQIALARSPSPAGAVEYIISPAPNADVTSPVTIKFGLKGMGVAPAGVDKPNTGHHHLLIDVTEIPLLDKPIPKDDHHLHFGGGQTETTLELSPGPHTLQLIFGDKDHMPFDPPVMSDRITINVK